MDFWKTLIVSGSFVGFVVSGLPIVAAQKPGTAAKGGSVRIEKQRTATVDVKSQTFHFRRIVQLLNLDFAELDEVYGSARASNSKLKFETVIKAFLAAERCSVNTNSDIGEKIVRASALTNSKVAPALRQVCSLSEEQAKAEEHHANERYRQAEREASR